MTYDDYCQRLNEFNTEINELDMQLDTIHQQWDTLLKQKDYFEHTSVTLQLEKKKIQDSYISKKQILNFIVLTGIYHLAFALFESFIVPFPVSLFLYFFHGLKVIGISSIFVIDANRVNHKKKQEESQVDRQLTQQEQDTQENEQKIKMISSERQHLFQQREELVGQRDAYSKLFGDVLNTYFNLQKDTVELPEDTSLKRYIKTNK